MNIVFLYTFLIILSFNLSQSCKCRITSVSESYDQEDAIFSGKVIFVEESLENLSNVFTFSLNNVWKGNLNETVKVSSGTHDCGIMFTKDNEYLVYANLNENNSLETSRCTRTSILFGNNDDISELNSICAKLTHT